MVAITHELKGSFGTIGAQRVMEQAAVIEQQAVALAVAQFKLPWPACWPRYQRAVRQLSALDPQLVGDPADWPLSDRSGT